MAPKLLHSLSVFATILTTFVALPVAGVRANGDGRHGSDFPKPSALPNWTDGHADELRGVYIPNILMDDVVQQPGRDATYVSTDADVLTQFDAARSVGSTGLLAHNYLAGARFALLGRGQMIYLVYGNGQMAAYVVTQALQYQALQPESPYSNFIDLSNGHAMSASEVFTAVYARPGDVILQTCINANDNPSWGRLFIVAEPYIPRPNVQ